MNEYTKDEGYVTERGRVPWEIDNLQNGCFMASTLLKRLFPSSTFVLGEFYTKKRVGSVNHAWVEMDGYIVDLTATQFNGLFLENFSRICIAKQEDFYDRNRDEFFYLPLFYNNTAQTMLLSNSAQTIDGWGCIQLAECFNQILIDELIDKISHP